MKFAIIALTVTLVACAQAGLVPLGWPYGHLVHPAAIGQYSSIPLVYAHGYPTVLHSHAPLVVDHAHAHVHAHAPLVIAAPGPATYQAITRGAVHTAPLEGHSVSQTSLNLEPAPGTL